MGSTSFSGPVFSGGMQLGLGIVSPNQRAPIPGGKIYYVSNLATATSLKTDIVPGDGTTPQTPFSSIAIAITKLVNRVNCGDIIYVLPGHVETIGVADYFGSTVSSAAGYSIVGLGSGTMRPVLNWTAAASTWLMNAANMEIANCILNLAVTAATLVVTPITISAAGVRIVDCFINWGVSTTIGCGTTLGAIAFTTAADDCAFLGNTCVNADTAGTNALALLSVNGADRIQIKDNKIFGATTATTVGPVHFLTTLSGNIEITNNYIENLIASATIALSSAISGVTGIVRDNTFRTQAATIQPVTVSANMSVTLKQNWSNNTANKNAGLVLGAGTAT